MKRAVVSLALIVSVLAACGAPEPDPFLAVREHIEGLVAEGGAPSVAVAVARDGEILWEEGFGLADREKNLPATEHTLYNLSYASTPLTATGLMILVERGLVDLDAPANDYLGDAVLHGCFGDPASATVRRLANHTAGLPGHYAIYYGDEPDQPPPLDEVILHYGNLVSPPGETWSFSDLNYAILGRAVSQVSGRSLGEFLQEEVFQPLGMADTSLGIDAGRAGEQAVPYSARGAPLPAWQYDAPGAAAIYSSAHDLIRFALFHLKDGLPGQTAIISQASIDEMQRPTARPFLNGYGIGWFIAEMEGGLHHVSHSGATVGASANLVLVPEENLAVAVLSNRGSRLPEEIANEILAALLPGRFVAPDLLGGQMASDPPFSPGPELVGVWAGLVYTPEGEVPLMLEIHEGGERIDVQWDLIRQPPPLLSGVSYGQDSTRFQSSGGGPFLRGCFPGRLGGEQMLRMPPQALCLELELDGGTLRGSLRAIAGSVERAGYSLAYCAELWRQD